MPGWVGAREIADAERGDDVAHDSDDLRVEAAYFSVQKWLLPCIRPGRRPPANLQEGAITFNAGTTWPGPHVRIGVFLPNKPRCFREVGKGAATFVPSGTIFLAISVKSGDLLRFVSQELCDVYFEVFDGHELHKKMSAGGQTTVISQLAAQVVAEHFGTRAIPEFEANLQMMDNLFNRQATSNPFCLQLYRTQHMDDREEVRTDASYGCVLAFRQSYKVRLTQPSVNTNGHLTVGMLTGIV